MNPLSESTSESENGTSTPAGLDPARLMPVYEAILSTTPDLAYVFDVRHQFIFANKALLTMWGKTMEEAMGRTCLQLGYEPWHAEMHDREIEQVIRTKESIRGEVPFNGTGGLRIYDYIFTPVFGPDGAVEAIAGTTRDVTDRKQEEQAKEFLSDLTARIVLLANGESPLAAIVEAVGKYLGVANCSFAEANEFHDLITVVEDWRLEGTRSIVGEYTSSDFGDDAWWANYKQGGCQIDDVETHPQTSAKARSYIAIGVRSYVARSHRIGDGRVLILSAGQSEPRKWTSSTVKLLDDVLSRLWPIAEKFRVEEALRKQSNRLQLLWEAAGILLRSDDPDQMLEQVFETIREPLGLDIYINFMVRDNAEVLDLCSYRGLTEEETVGFRVLGFGEALCGTSAASRCPIIVNHLQSDANPKADAVRGLGLLSYLCNPLMAGDSLLGTLSFGSRRRDVFSEEEVKFIETITHYVTAAYVRLKLLNSLRDSDRRKDQFLATLAHELRNPLAPILTGLDVIASSAARPEMVAKVSTMMRRQLGQMTHLIDDLLDLSRITTGKFVLKPQSVDLISVVSEAVEASRPVIDSCGHTLELRFEPGPLMLDCDPHRVSQVVSNLLLNASRYTPCGGSITLSVDRPENGWARVIIADNGVGIDPDAQERIFDMFEQEDMSRNDGLGIGLTLVKTLVEMHGGGIRLKSEGRGKGSEFSITLPATVAQAIALDENGSASGTRLPTRSRVLVVDDERATADVMGMLLEADGLETDVAYDGLEALEKADSFRPDLVFMDLGMPRMDGFQAAVEMKKRHPHVVLIALSGWGRDEDKQRSAVAGFDAHIVKPAKPDEIRSYIQLLDHDPTRRSTRQSA